MKNSPAKLFFGAFGLAALASIPLTAQNAVSPPGLPRNMDRLVAQPAYGITTSRQDIARLTLLPGPAPASGAAVNTGLSFVSAFSTPPGSMLRAPIGTWSFVRVPATATDSVKPSLKGSPGRITLSPDNQRNFTPPAPRTPTSELFRFDLKLQSPKLTPSPAKSPDAR